MRARLTAVLLATIVAASCSPSTIQARAGADTLAPTTTTTAACCTPEQAEYLAAVAWQHAETVAFLTSVAIARASVPDQLRVIMWCEAGRYLGLPIPQTNYQAKTHGYDGASGGGQAVGDTWLTWAGELGVDTARWPRAYLAPDWVQDQVLTHGYLTRGTTPWNASKGCWASRT